MKTWQLQEAKASLSQVVKDTLVKGPQTITVHGAPTVVLVSLVEFQRLTKPTVSFVEFMRRSPLVGLDLELERDSSSIRNVDL